MKYITKILEAYKYNIHCLRLKRQPLPELANESKSSWLDVLNFHHTPCFHQHCICPGWSLQIYCKMYLMSWLGFINLFNSSCTQDAHNILLSHTFALFPSLCVYLLTTTTNKNNHLCCAHMIKHLRFEVSAIAEVQRRKFLWKSTAWIHVV